MLSRGDDNMCFICGEDNPISLKIEFEYNEEKDQVSAKYFPDEKLAGYNDIMHGGIVTALLDEAMAKAVIQRGWKAVTAEMKVRFLEPVRLDRQVNIIGRVQEKRRRIIEASARLEGKLGEELARAKAKFVIKDKSVKE
ncbi:MAG: PaaI family thioesterase [Bacillota bacterium]